MWKREPVADHLFRLVLPPSLDSPGTIPDDLPDEQLLAANLEPRYADIVNYSTSGVCSMILPYPKGDLLCIHAGTMFGKIHTSSI